MHKVYDDYVHSSGTCGSLGGSSSHTSGGSASRSPPRRSGKGVMSSQRMPHRSTDRSQSPARRKEEGSMNEIRSHQSRSPPPRAGPRMHDGVGYESNPSRKGAFLAETGYDQMQCVFKT